MRQYAIVLSVSLLLAGCGSGTSTPATAQPAQQNNSGATVYHSVLKSADITTTLKHIVFFNTTTSTFIKYDNLVTITKGSIRDQAFVCDAILEVPLPFNEQDAIAANPVDPLLYTVVRQSGGYFLKNNMSGETTGPYASAIKRSNVDIDVHIITFDMLLTPDSYVESPQSDLPAVFSGAFKSRLVPASAMYDNMFSDGGAILVPLDGVYNGHDINSGYWKIDSVSGRLVPNQ